MGWEDKYSNPDTWAKQREKITLVCTSNNIDKSYVHKMLLSAKGFDRTVLHYDGGAIHLNNAIIVGPPPMNIPDAYNLLIENFVNTEWVCCFCDDDYFYPEGLSKMISEVHTGIDADVAHFKFHVSGHIPRQDYRGRIFKAITGKSEYDLCEKQPITPELLTRHNRLPHGSFFRKSAWEKIGGYQGSFEHDRNLWLRMSQAGCKFKYYDYLVYNFCRRENSAWIKQDAQR